MARLIDDLAGFDRQRLGWIADWMQRYVDKRRFAGCSVLIQRHGQEVFYHQTGQRNLEADLPFERDTVVRLYSMTKPITSVAIMILAERGLFHLEAPLSAFIPAFKDMHCLIADAQRIDQTAPCATPTLHQLLTHTSGLSYPFNPGLLPQAMDEAKMIFGPKQGPLERVADSLADFPLAFAPGKRWEYSVATDVLGRVVEVVSGKSLATFFADEIFAPLGMTETAFRVPEHVGDRFAALYTPLEGNAMALNEAKTGGETLRLADAPETSALHETVTYSGGGGLVGTIDDYMRFAEMLRQGGQAGEERLLSPRTLSFMMRNHLPGDIASMGPQSFAEQPMEGMGFGLGGAVVLDPGRARSPGSIGDFSWGGMASTFFWVDPVEDLSVVFFTQLSPSSAYPARPELKALVHGALVR
ncbi:serine hydrolase [Thalassococcus sp. S3]|uniref:serine hydrolase domain-containing protein n=1 Tax=Thalassococcus sp. S3 TaxID=2017482 RepID=UPI001024295A|nr:serine hydrolase domain-containing protein [Thalassococcus sp. S3]QBF31914.1 serine hydrolase [Thalassococcus sp. S3]